MTLPRMTKPMMGFVLLPLLTGCIEQDVIINDATTAVRGLAPTLRYAYFREDPVRNRIHLRLSDYWDPCITDAQFQNQYRNRPNPQERADSYAALLPADAWTADLYLHVADWPSQPRQDLSFEGGNTQGLLETVLFDCPFDASCDDDLPSIGGEFLGGFTRTTDHLEASYFENAVSQRRIPLIVSSGVMQVDGWLPALGPANSKGQVEGPINADAQLIGTARVSLRQVGDDVDNGVVELEFAARHCEAMQAAYTSNVASFDLEDLNQYAPPAGCQTAPAGMLGVYALPLWWLGRRRRTNKATKPSPRPNPRGAGLV